MQVFYFYEPCRSLDWGEDPAGSAAAQARQDCEALSVRLLCCNATESDLKLLLKDWRAAKRDGGLLRVASAVNCRRSHGVPPTLLCFLECTPMTASLPK